MSRSGRIRVLWRLSGITLDPLCERTEVLVGERKDKFDHLIVFLCVCNATDAVSAYTQAMIQGTETGIFARGPIAKSCLDFRGLILAGLLNIRVHAEA